jgi:hypothetical protein
VGVVTPRVGVVTPRVGVVTPRVGVVTPRVGVVTPRGPGPEGVRDAGCLMHPQPRAQKRVARPRTSINSGGTGKPGHPARNGVTAYTVLSSGRCSLRPSSRGLRFCLRPVGPTSLRRT